MGMKNKRNIILALVIILAVVLVILLFGLLGHKESASNVNLAGSENNSSESVIRETDSNESAVNKTEIQKQETDTSSEMTETQTISETTVSSETKKESQVTSEIKKESQVTSEVIGSEESKSTESVSATEKESVPDVTQESEVVQQVTVEYEKWLAAAMVVGVSIEYPDFELVDICTETCKELTDSQSSKGVYILFKSSGTEMAVYGVPLEQERTTPGTIDISTMNMGFATFDMVDVNQIPKVGFISYTMEDLEDTISQTMQFSLYYH